MSNTQNESAEDEKEELSKANKRIDELDNIIDDLGNFVDEAFHQAIWMHGEGLEERLSEIVGSSWRILSESYFDSMRELLDEEGIEDPVEIKELEDNIQLARELYREHNSEEAEPGSVLRGRQQQRDQELSDKNVRSLQVIRAVLATPEDLNEKQAVIDKELRRIMWDYKKFDADEIRPILNQLFEVCADSISKEFLRTSKNTMMDGMFEGNSILAVAKQYRIANEMLSEFLNNEDNGEQ